MVGLKDFSSKRILIAVDESDNARRAVSYVAETICGSEGFTVIVLHVIPEPEEDYFQSDEEKEEWIASRRETMGSYLVELQDILEKGGMDSRSISTRVARKRCPSLSQCILEEQDREECGTLVVGRHGISFKEEVLFGSVSSTVIHHAQNCTVWVVN